MYVLSFDAAISARKLSEKISVTKDTALLMLKKLKQGGQQYVNKIAELKLN